MRYYVYVAVIYYKILLVGDPVSWQGVFHAIFVPCADVCNSISPATRSIIVTNTNSCLSQSLKNI